jgi:hypothetical protein
MQMYPPRSMNAMPGQGGWAQQSGQMMPAAEPAMQPPAPRRWLSFLLWGMLFALIGFGIVGVLLHFTR